MNYSISLSNDSLTAVFTGGTPGGVRIHTINSSHPSWQEAINVITNHGDGATLEKLMSVKETIVKFAHGKITVSDNEVLYDGKPVHGFVVSRILEFAKNGLPYQPLVKFLDRVRLNTSARSVEELYRFLEHRKMPITPDGTFLAYKSVRANYTDHHTGTIRNRVGDSPTRLERNQVDDDANRGCSYGYHVGSLEYAESFGGGERHLMIVEVDPADVVSVPYDCNCQKLRCTWYKVIDEFKHVLDDNYSTQYHDDTDYDDEDDESYDDDEGVSVDDAYALGYDQGYESALHHDGYDDTIDPTENSDFDIIANASDLTLAYENGYHEGYDKGVIDRG